jgi:hypothetical protein
MARSVRCSAETIYMIALGHKSPSLALAQRIAKATRGRVGLDVWPERGAKVRRSAKKKRAAA